MVCDFRYRIGVAPGGTGSDTHGPARQYRTQAAGAAGPFVERGVFKNPPEGTSAGKLLDEAGFRGKRLGGMCFSEIHANFLVNEGKGSADAALELIRSAQSAVWERFGIQLQTEVKLWVF